MKKTFILILTFIFSAYLSLSAQAPIPPKQEPKKEKVKKQEPKQESQLDKKDRKESKAKMKDEQ